MAWWIGEKQELGECISIVTVRSGRRARSEAASDGCGRG